MAQASNFWINGGFGLHHGLDRLMKAEGTRAAGGHTGLVAAHRAALTDRAGGTKMRLV